MFSARQIDRFSSLIEDQDGTQVCICDARYVALLVAAPAREAALESIHACATARLADISGDCHTYEDAFRKLEIAVGALQFIANQADPDVVRAVGAAGGGAGEAASG